MTFQNIDIFSMNFKCFIKISGVLQARVGFELSY